MAAAIDATSTTDDRAVARAISLGGVFAGPAASAGFAASVARIDAAVTGLDLRVTGVQPSAARKM